MAQERVPTIVEHFADVEDPRNGRRKDHLLLDIITIAICAVICGADGWVAVEEFGKAKEKWLSSFLKLPKGIPSHDTFGRVFARVDPEQFQSGFLSWVQAISEVIEGEAVAFDGKKLRRSHDGILGKAAIHMVSAWAAANRLVLGQLKVDDKSNEITAIPALLKLLEIKGCIVTIDALGCQTEIAELIIEKEADYVLALKGNQGTLHGDVQDLFAYAQEIDFQDVTHDFHRTVDKGHGRIEIRRYWTISEPEWISYLDPNGKWKNLSSIGMVQSERRIADQVTCETRYYILSTAGDAMGFGQAVREHWGIENKVHWVLDVAFREDDCRVRKGNAAQNLAVLRHIALNLLRHEQTAKCGTQTKRLKAGWDHRYLLKVLTG
jgi:predicted transposase YbfD/YdcC